MQSLKDIELDRLAISEGWAPYDGLGPRDQFDSYVYFHIIDGQKRIEERPTITYYRTALPPCFSPERKTSIALYYRRK